jgi:hypothetical protein
MGLFDRSKMSKAAGEWAAQAMACVVFADGSASEPEIAAAQDQLATNPVLKESIGTKKATALFNQTIEAIRPVPSAMLHSYEGELAELAQKVKDVNDKNFALSTLIAVSMGDGTLSQTEYDMIMRFKESLGATVPIPRPGADLPEAYKPEQQAAAPAADQGPIDCPTCGKPTQFYEGYGHWCNDCQQYAPAPAQAQPEAVQTPAADAQAVATESAVNCANCGKPTQFYEGYGHWCADCQQYTTA